MKRLESPELSLLLAIESGRATRFDEEGLGRSLPIRKLRPGCRPSRDGADRAVASGAGGSTGSRPRILALGPLLLLRLVADRQAGTVGGWEKGGHDGLVRQASTCDCDPRVGGIEKGKIRLEFTM